MMKRILTSSALSLALLLGAAAPAAIAKGRKESPEHKAAVKKCNDDYRVAVKEAKTKQGKDRTAALAAAKASHKQCIADAPK
jgi:uncharacterized low-complexity protein